MDPNAALKAIRDAVGEFDVDVESDELEDTIVLHFMALDGWLTSGGFLPAAWDHTTRGVTFDSHLIAEAHGLRSEHGENPEYDRGLVELIIRMTPGASHDEHTDLVSDLIGVVDGEVEDSDERVFRCRDCKHPLHQMPEKALSGEYAMVWGDQDDDWVCAVTGDEHRIGVTS